MPNEEMIGVFTKDEMLQILSHQSEAGNAIVVSGLVEDWLEKLLLAKGRSIFNKTAKRIFEGIGPLSSFSAKIDVAYLFELIDRDIARDLRIINDIRNDLAHTTKFVHFGTERI